MTSYKTIKTSELTGAALDWAVAKCEQPGYETWRTSEWVRQRFHPSTDWAQGGPIMERQGIGATVVSPSGDEMWLGANYKGRSVEYGPACLIACMRTYVAAELGDTVEVPDELAV